MRILRSADHRRMPWKNGGGETVEIVVHPAGAGLADFDWRVSMAHVAADGPFSRFDGIDRTLSILEGEGLRLQVEGLDETALTRESDPFAFPADAPTQAFLLSGPITDLNLMTRRGKARHRVERHLIAGRVEIAPVRGWTLILPRGALVFEREGLDPVSCDAGDAVLLEGPAPELRVRAMGTLVFVVRIEAVED